MRRGSNPCYFLWRFTGWGVVVVVWASRAAWAGTIGIHSVSTSSGEVGLYEPLTVAFNLSRSYDNPYDPDLVDVRFEFIGPTQIARIIPAYWTDQSPPWRARIVPLETGIHQCRILVNDSFGDSGSYPLSFTAVPSNAPGFLRIDSRNPRYLRFDNGRPYLPVGQNVCWYGGNGLFDTWLNNMAAVGQNWTRYWLVPYVGQDIEWGGGTSYQLGRYSQSNARLLDDMFEAARVRGVCVQACLDSFNGWNLTLYTNWNENPYNAANGGMCAVPMDYFLNSEAQRYARRRFRYIVARWAWNPAILCWEFFNEVDAVGSAGATFWGHEAEVAAWHQSMAQYIRSIDPFQHLRTTSFADDGPRSSYALFWQLAEMDLVQVHQYHNSYPREHVNLIRQVQTFNKPVILGEADAAGVPSDLDSNGQSLHDIIWAAAVVESGAMSWWWDNWIHPQNLYYRFAPLSAFLDGEDWAPQQLSALNYTVLSGHTTPEIYGSGGSANACLYVRNWWGPISGLRLRLNQVTRSGSYELQWWDTYSSVPFRTDVIAGDPGGLILDVPDFNRDVAVKVRYLGPAFHTTTDSLNAIVWQGRQAAGQSFGLSNTGSGTIHYTVASDAGFCVVAPSSGSVSSETDTITATFNSAELPPATYSATITIADTSGECPPALVSVTLEVKALPADFDADADVDQEDFGVLQVCLTGPGIPQAAPDCRSARLDEDDDVDSDDVRLFGACLSGPGIFSDPDCLQ